MLLSPPFVVSLSFSPSFIFSVLLVYLSLFRFSFFFFSCVCLFFRASYHLFGLCSSLGRPVTVETWLYIAARKLSIPSVIRFICIISSIGGCSKSTESIRRECSRFIAWPQGCDIGFRSHEHMCRCAPWRSRIRKYAINLSALGTVLNPDAVNG